MKAALAVVALALTVSSLAHAQAGGEKAAAEALFNDGLRAMESGSFAEACKKLASSEALDPAIGTALYLGECYERSSRIASAWATFKEAQDLAERRNDKRASIAKARVARLAPSKLTIILAPGAVVDGLEIERDEVVVRAALLGFSVPTDGGSHTIRASAPGKKPFEQTIVLDAQNADVTITVPKLEDAKEGTPEPTPTRAATPTPTTPTPAGPASHETPTASPGTGQRVAGLLIAGVGLAGVGVGTAFAVLGGNDWHSSNTVGQCDASSSLCLTQAGVDSRAAAQTESLVSTVAFVAGGVAIVLGVVLFFTAPKAAAKTTAALMATGRGLGMPF